LAIDFLGELPEPVIERLAARTRVALYSDGEEVIRQGEPGSELFIVRRGEVVVLVGKDGKRPVEVARLGPGKFFGEMSLMTGEARTATVVTDGTCELFVVGHAEIREMLESEPELAQHFAEVLAGRRLELGEQASDAGDEEEASAQTSVLLSRIKSFFSL
jgi:CRP-like cAMP-binding protein